MKVIRSKRLKNVLKDPKAAEQLRAFWRRPRSLSPATWKSPFKIQRVTPCAISPDSSAWPGQELPRSEVRTFDHATFSARTTLRSWQLDRT